MSSGTYFPKPVKAAAIPKKNGGKRILGIPTVEDRIAQMVAKLYFEPNVERIFYEDSYGYRPNKSAIQALEVTSKKGVGGKRFGCWNSTSKVYSIISITISYSKWLKSTQMKNGYYFISEDG